MVEKEIDELLREINETASQSKSTEEACAEVALKRHGEGYELSAETLHCLVKLDREGKLSWRLSSLIYGKLTKGLKRKVQEISRRHHESIRDILALAVGSYQEE